VRCSASAARSRLSGSSPERPAIRAPVSSKCRTGAATPGGKDPVLTVPQPLHSRMTATCSSITRNTISSGRSNTWRDSSPSSTRSAPARFPPRPAHASGSCGTRASGTAARSK
jgi:hypothetical protein